MDAPFICCGYCDNVVPRQDWNDSDRAVIVENGIKAVEKGVGNLAVMYHASCYNHIVECPSCKTRNLLRRGNVERCTNFECDYYRVILPVIPEEMNGLCPICNKMTLVMKEDHDICTSPKCAYSYIKNRESGFEREGECSMCRVPGLLKAHLCFRCLEIVRGVHSTHHGLPYDQELDYHVCCQCEQGFFTFGYDPFRYSDYCSRCYFLQNPPLSEKARAELRQSLRLGHPLVEKNRK